TIEAQSFTLERTALQDHSSLTTDHLPLTLPLLGRHQVTNAATAIAAVAVLQQQGTTVPEDAIREGLSKVQWHGRFEVLEREPLLVVDGAHNADSARQLVQTIRTLRPAGALHLIFGASSDKDIAGMFAQLLPQVQSLILTRSHNPRASDPARLAALAEPFNVEISIEPDLAAALEEAGRRARTVDTICVTGSLFVVADARQVWLERHGQTVEHDG
ncbi:MAG: glutamate ligase domain-containing protein, partial [Acidobacteriota bacterium]